MNSLHNKVKSKNDSFHNSSRISSSSNVNSLRKLFENNFKLSNITNVFKSKSNKDDYSPKEDDDSVKSGSHVGCGHIACASKENRICYQNSENAVPGRRANAFLADGADNGNYLNCKIENCCCKTFFREYDETPNFRYRQLPKVPLRERRSGVNRLSGDFGDTAQQSNETEVDNVSLNSYTSKNKYYKINYEFYKSKTQQVFDDTPLSSGTEKKFERPRKGEGKNLFDKIDGTDKTISSRKRNRKADGRKKNVLPPRGYEKSDAFGFVNFTATSLSEGGYVKLREEKKPLFQTAQKNSSDTPVPDGKSGTEAISSKIDATDEIYKIGNFTFKYRVPKMKNLVIREQTYPYILRKPRLTVKGVKNRNMRNIKRRQKFKSLDRAQTFSGYDNFAYRRSITELHLPKCEEEVNENCEVVQTVTPSLELKDSTSGENGNVGESDANNRMKVYSWPITSFYIDKNVTESLPRQEGRRYSSSYNLSGVDSGKSEDIVRRKTNLKRHCSLGYLEDECYEYNALRHRRSLDNIPSKLKLLIFFLRFLLISIASW